MANKLATKKQDPEAHKRHLATRKAWRELNKERLKQKEIEYKASPSYKEKKRKWAQTYRDRNREKLVDSNREYRQRLKSLDPVIPVSNKAAIDKVVFRKRDEEKKHAERHKKRQSKRDKMLNCSHQSGFTFEPHLLGGVVRKCKICGKKFRQIGR